MNTEYAIDVLKRRKRELESEKYIIESELEIGIARNRRRKTEIHHQLTSLQFSLEILETWED